MKNENIIIESYQVLSPEIANSIKKRKKESNILEAFYNLYIKNKYKDLKSSKIGIVMRESTINNWIEKSLILKEIIKNNKTLN